MDPAQELADLQNRFHLLEGDRKAFYEQSQQTLKQNKEVCDQLRGENKELRAAMGGSKDKGTTGAEASAIQDAELARVEGQLTQMRQRHNQIACGNKAKETTLTKLEDELRDLQRSSSRPAHEANPLMRQIRTLENRLDKAMIKYNEAQSIRKTYDQIVKRLKQERVNFDNQLGAIEATLHAKEHDYEELLLMSHDASHAKDVAKAELAKLQALVSEERKAREKELVERRSAVQAREEMHTRMVEREKARHDIMLEAKGDLSDDAEKALKQNVVTNALHHQLNSNVVEGEQQVMSAYESAFRKIKEATGVGDVNEVIQKFLTQEQTHDNLVEMTKVAQARIESLGEERASTKVMVDEMKYSGGGGQSSRQEVEQWERKLTDAQSAVERVRVRQQRMTKVFIDIRAGVEHMADKLDSVKIDAPSVPVSDETIIDVMLQCDAKLLKMYDVVGSMPDDDADGRSALRSRGDLSPDLGGRLATPGGLARDASGAEHSFNVRVALTDQEFEGMDDDDDDELEGMEADILDRNQMKKMHGQMLDKATAKSKRKKKGGKFGAEATQSRMSPPKARGTDGRTSVTIGRRSLDTE